MNISSNFKYINDWEKKGKYLLLKYCMVYERRDVKTNSYSIGLYCFLLLFLLLFQIEGEWNTVAIAADNVDKIEPAGEMRLYCRKITCEEVCKKLKITFYVH